MDTECSTTRRRWSGGDVASHHSPCFFLRPTSSGCAIRSERNLRRMAKGDLITLERPQSMDGVSESAESVFIHRQGAYDYHVHMSM